MDYNSCIAELVDIHSLCVSSPSIKSLICMTRILENDEYLVSRSKSSLSTEVQYSNPALVKLQRLKTELSLWSTREEFQGKLLLKWCWGVWSCISWSSNKTSTYCWHILHNPQEIESFSYLEIFCKVYKAVWGKIFLFSWCRTINQRRSGDKLK